MSYVNSFIVVADDCKVSSSEAPNLNKETVASIQYKMLVDDPYIHTQEEVLFASTRVARDNPDMSASEREAAFDAYFSKPQACLRTSPLPKKHGFGFHFDQDGKVAMYPMESSEYEKYSQDETLKVMKALRSSRA